MNPLKIYLAAPYSMKREINARAEELRANGIIVTSSWLEERHDPNIQMHDMTSEDHRKYAVQDILDVMAADILVFWTDPTKTIIRAGRHVEFGVALGIGITRKIPIFVVGLEHENIFHYLPVVTHFDSWEKVKPLLCAMV